MSPCLLRGQMDTLVVLEPVEVKTEAIRVGTPGQKTEEWTKEELNILSSQHIGEVISRKGGVFIKSYGAGSIATSSIRGGNAGQTLVLWNGLPLQNPMLGLLDLSLIPTGFVDQMSVHYGGNSAGWGNGAISGVIDLRNSPQLISGFSASVRSSFGSFGHWDQQAQLTYGRGKLKGSSRLSHQQADNDFTYSISPKLPDRQQEHAHYEQDGFMQELYYSISPRQQLGAQLWWQKNDREIPPLTTQNESQAVLIDESIRTALHWKYTGETAFFQAKAGYFDEEQLYQDPLTGLNTVNEFRTFLLEGEAQWQIDQNMQAQLGVLHIRNNAEAGAYGSAITSKQYAILGTFKRQWGKWLTQLNLRQEWQDGERIPFVPGLGIKGQLLKGLWLNAKVSRNYRLAGMNDRFWQPGGNPDLIAESGWSEELGLEGKFTRGKHQFKYSLTGFHRDINNWILWALIEGESFFSANNITKVRSRGIEQRFSWQFPIEDVNVHLRAGYDYTRSTNEIALKSPRIAAGQQLIYVPRHQAFGELALTWKTLRFSWLHRYTGSVRSINEGDLPDYQISSLSLSSRISKKRFSGDLFFRIENLTNQNYQIIERRPMPGRHFQMGFQLKFNQKNN